MRRLHARYQLAGTLMASSAVHVGGLGPDGAVDLGQVRDGMDRVILPGSSLAGVLRAAMGDTDATWWGKDLTGDRHLDRESGASRIVVADAVGKDRIHLHIRDGVSIDRMTGAAAARHLFTRYVVPAGSGFDFDLAIEVPDSDEDPLARNLMMKIVGLLSGPGITVGAAVTRGLGRMRLREFSLRRVDLASRDGILALLADKSDVIETSTSVQHLGAPPGTLRITVPWRAVGPVLCKVSDDGGVADSFPATAFGDDGTLRLVLPGSSLKGALRSHAERIVRTITGETVADDATFVDQMSASAHLPTIGDVFGAATDHRSDAGWRGVLTVHEITSKVVIPAAQWRAVRDNGAGAEGNDEQRRSVFATAVAELNSACEANGLWFDIASRNAIDRWTGGAADGLLYTGVEPYALGADVWSDLVLDVDIVRARRRQETSVDAILALLLFVLRDFADGWLPIGFGTTRGLGTVSADPATIRFDYDAKEADVDIVTELTGKSLSDIVGDRELTARLENAWARAVPELQPQ